MLKKVSKNAERQRRHARVRTKVSGTADRPRLNVFRSNSHISAQLIDDVNGVTLVSAKKAIAKGIDTVVFDRGGYLYHGRVKALADAAREAGLVF